MRRKMTLIISYDVLIYYMPTFNSLASESDPPGMYLP